MFRAGPLIALGVLTCSTASAEWSTRGDVRVQLQAFTDNAVHAATQSSNTSAAFEVEISTAIGDNGSFTITPFFRIDQHDDQRTHFDFREFLYSHYASSWELNVGLGKIFWGVTESQNLVDIINQSDAVEGFGSSAKLGQAMVNINWLPDWGSVGFYVLPGFRERTLAGINGRPRIPNTIDADNAEFESDKKNQHVDFAARVSTALNEWDIGIHAFHGTAREPSYKPNADGSMLVPFYYQLTQVGLDVQATLSNWLLKAEFVSRQGKNLINHTAFVSGLEYSFYSIANSNTNLGIVAEWFYDDRNARTPNPFQNDALVALRFALNDEQSTEALVGAVFDLKGGGTSFSLEASRRFGSAFRLGVEAFVWNAAESDPNSKALSQEDYLQLELSYFF